MKNKGTLTAEQSRFLGGVLNAPLLEDSETRDVLLKLYLDSESESLYPEEFGEDVIAYIKRAIATAEKAADLDNDATPENIVNATPSPFAIEEEIL